MTSCFWSPTMSSFSVSALNLAQELQVRNLGFLLAWLLGDCGSGTCHLTSLLQLSIATYKTTQNLMAYNNNCFIMSHNFMGRKFKHVLGGLFSSTWSQMGHWYWQLLWSRVPQTASLTSVGWHCSLYTWLVQYCQYWKVGLPHSKIVSGQLDF